VVSHLRGENGHLFLGLDVAKAELQREAVHLRFRQRVGAAELHGVLRGDHEERIVQAVRGAVHGDLPLAHRLQQRRLRAWRGAIDLVGEQHVGEDRALVEAEGLVALVVDRDAENVGGQQVGRELDALEGRPDRARERLGECRLARARVVFQQHVAATGEGGQQAADGQRLPLHDGREIRRDAPGDVARRSGAHLVCDAFLIVSSRSACMPSCSFAVSFLTSDV